MASKKSATTNRRRRNDEPQTLKDLLKAPEREASLTVPAGRIPPQAVDAEQSLLGCVLLDGETMYRVADIVRTDDFYKKEHRAIYQALLQLYAKRESIDILSLAKTLEDGGVLEDIGGHTYLTSLVNRVPTPTHAVQYAKIVKKKQAHRELIDAAYAIAELGWSETEDVEKLLDEAEQRIFQISQHSVQQDFSAVSSSLEEAYARIEALAQHADGGIRGVPTGFHDLDNLLSGLQPSDFVVLAARPSLGKTSLALDIARNVAVQEKKPVGIFSIEMSRAQIVDRLLAAESRVNLWKMRNGKLSGDDFDRLRDALDRLADAPIFVDDNPTPTPLQMRTMARRLQVEHGLELIIVDYMQLIDAQSTSDNLVHQVTEISRSLKAMARELNVPVLALSQLSRAVEGRPDQVPKLSDLRESGSIEQDADVVMFIYREDRVKPEMAQKGLAEIHIAKHRNGPIGKVQLRFDEEHASFWSLDRRHASPNDVPLV
jgi:replicative DNA helicase